MVGVTAGLLSELDRIELEAVLAEELIQIRRRETLPATVLVGTFGIGRALALPPDRDAEMDQAAVALTRYPPGPGLGSRKARRQGRGGRRPTRRRWPTCGSPTRARDRRRGGAA